MERLLSITQTGTKRVRTSLGGGVGEPFGPPVSPIFAPKCSVQFSFFSIYRTSVISHLSPQWDINEEIELFLVNRLNYLKLILYLAVL